MNKSYYAIIPANVRYDERLTPNAKLLYGEITALCNERGYCWASNKYFSELYKKSIVTVSKWISQLKEYGYISTMMIYKPDSRQIVERRIEIAPSHPIKENLNTPIKENLNTPIKENLKDNNTLINSRNFPDGKSPDPSEDIQKIIDLTAKIDLSNDDILHRFANWKKHDGTYKGLKELMIYQQRYPYIPLAKLLYQEHKKHDEQYLAGKDLEKTFSRWANDIRLLIERDKRNYETVQAVIIWCQSPGCFWVPNILSGKKLRAKFPMLYSQYQQEKNRRSRDSGNGKQTAWQRQYADKLSQLEE